MDPTVAVISNASNVVDAIVNLEKLGVVSILVLIIVFQYFNQRNFFKALRGLEDIIKVLKQDNDNREDKNAEIRKEIRNEIKEMNRELMEIKVVINTLKVSHSCKDK